LGSITVDKYPKPISVDISKTYQVDRIWSHITVDKYPKPISVDISKTYFHE